jgi:hypothetical protein
MSTQDELLSDTVIAEFIATHRGAEKRIRRAAEQLAETVEPLTALRKLLSTLDEQIVHVFFSYKRKDEDVAKAIVQILRRHSAGKLQISYMADFGKEIVGKLWRDKIRDEIRKANWFILLLQNPSDDWDWCLYETGLFEAHGTSADRLICLHHPNIDVPNQIEPYQAVSAKIPEVENFLRWVYLEDDSVPGMRAINKEIENGIPEIAKNVVELIRAPKNVCEQVFPPTVKLKIERLSAGPISEENFDAAIVVRCNQEALDLFGGSALIYRMKN